MRITYYLHNGESRTVLYDVQHAGAVLEYYDNGVECGDIVGYDYDED